jgi:pimeloyl-ACP methyl ester carboxylesterase
MPQLAANGLTFYVEDAGPSDAPAVLLIMGLALPAAAWPDGFVERLLGHGLRVIRFDNRDCGGSSRIHAGRSPDVRIAVARALLRLPVDAPYTLDDLTDDAIGVLDALGVTRAHLVGVSMGGMIAQLLAVRAPRRTLSLTSMMSSAGNRDPRVALGRITALRALLRRPRALDTVAEVTEHLMHVFAVIGSPGFRPGTDELRRQLRRVAERGYDLDGARRQLLAILAADDRRAQLAHIQAPTLVIHGVDDPLVPVAAGIDTARHIAGAQLLIVPGMGHDFAPALQPMLADAIAAHVRHAERVAATASTDATSA